MLSLKILKTGCLKQQTLFCYTCEIWESNIRIPVWLGFLCGFIPGLQETISILYHHMAMRTRGGRRDSVLEKGEREISPAH